MDAWYHKEKSTVPRRAILKKTARAGGIVDATKIGKAGTQTRDCA